MTGTLIVLATESALASVQAARLAALRLQTAIEGGHAVQANGRLFCLMMMSLGHNALVGHSARQTTLEDLRTIIRNEGELG